MSIVVIVYFVILQELVCYRLLSQHINWSFGLVM